MHTRGDDTARRLGVCGWARRVNTPGVGGQHQRVALLPWDVVGSQGTGDGTGAAQVGGTKPANQTGTEAQVWLGGSTGAARVGGTKPANRTGIEAPVWLGGVLQTSINAWVPEGMKLATTQKLNEVDELAKCPSLTRWVSWLKPELDKVSKLAKAWAQQGKQAG